LLYDEIGTLDRAVELIDEIAGKKIAALIELLFLVIQLENVRRVFIATYFCCEYFGRT
jgi:hypothetical protein